MVKAVVSHGEIRPQEPLPTDWREGQVLRVERMDENTINVDEIDQDFATLDRLCMANDEADEKQLALAIQKAKEQSKEQVRRQMGLN